VRIRIGLLQSSAGWEEYLRQEGVPFSSVVFPDQDLTPDRFSVLVVNRPLTRGECESVDRYVREGGAVAGYALYLRGVCGVETRSELLEFLVGEGKAPFDSLMLLDLGLEGEIPREASTVRTQHHAHAIAAGSRDKGAVVIFPFDPEEALCDERSTTKNFYSRLDRLPAERVSLVAKGEVRHLLHSALVYLHAVRGIPYVHLWYYPGRSRNIFAFRVDTDFASKESIDELYSVARSHAAGMTWFMDVRSHEPLLPHFASMIGQEIGVHCYDHRVDNHDGANLANFGRAKRALEDAGFRVEGFAAPLGIWNPSVARVTKELGFLYSSEFSWAYDTLPGHAVVRDRQQGVLQVPIHPICIGSLRRAGYNERQMTEYFGLMVQWKLARNEPLIFYHHPSHGHPGVVDALFDVVGESGIPGVLMSEYARWWRLRGGVDLDITVQSGVIDCEMPVEGAERFAGLVLRVIRAPGEEALTDLAPRIFSDRLEWSARPACRPPDDLRRIREFDPRRVLGDLYSRMTRRIR
jgi:hypothetical protein